MDPTSATRPTILDVARAAGVSKSLVSAALRGEPGVRSESRERIIRAADSLGYRTNVWARRLVNGRSNLIGVLLTDLRNAYHTDIVNGVEDAAGEHGHGVLLSHGRRDRALLRRRLAELLDLGVDGIIAVTAHLDAHDLEYAAGRLPVIVVGRPPSLPEAAGSVRNDDETGARVAVEHLLDLGHTRIAFATGSRRPAATARRETYRNVVAAAGHEPHMVTGDAGGIEALVESVARPDGPSAVFAANDRIAASVLAAAADRGLRIPDDLSVVGYDNTDLAALVRPGLTSVDQPREMMGRSAVALLAQLASGADPVHEVAAPALVVRESSAPRKPMWAAPPTT